MQGIIRKVIFGFVLVTTLICWGIPKGFAGVAVLVDVNPQSCPNPLNCDKKGVISVAILGAPDFDAAQIECSTLLLQGVLALRCALEDVATPFSGDLIDCFDCNESAPDGLTDLVVKFDAQEVLQAIGPVTNGDCVPLTLTGLLFDGESISGMDNVVIRCR